LHFPRRWLLPRLFALHAYFSAIGRVYTRVYKYNPLRTEIKFPENRTVTDKIKYSRETDGYKVSKQL